ncbi:tail fiber domain-containing protein [Serratia marcescens]|uniref:tail fiber domain-containing protein n=1 Tax=Serratia marcescens TaxID=615 RepID=UPI003FA780D3
MNISTGKDLQIFYTSDTGNNSPSFGGYQEVANIAEFPTIKQSSSVENLETYNSDYSSVLTGDKSIDAFPITVNYVIDEPSHKFLEQAAEQQTPIQVKVKYTTDEEANAESYIVLNGYVQSHNLTGDKDAVVQRSYLFTPETVVTQGFAPIQPLLRRSDYGLGSDGIDAPQYTPATGQIAGNGFIQIPAAATGNPASTNLIGVGLTNNKNEASIVMSETGDLKLYARNQNTAWTRIYTSTEQDTRYARLDQPANFGNLTITGTISSTGTVTVPGNQGIKTAPVNGASAALSSEQGYGIIWRNNEPLGTKANEWFGINPNSQLQFRQANDTTSGLWTVRNVYHEGFKPSKSDVGLSNVLNSAQLTVANNLSDLSNKATSRTNLGLGNAATLNTGTSTGNVVTVGDYGLGAFVTASSDTDLNTLKDGSFCTVVTNPVNAPTGATGTWFLQVLTWNSGGTPPVGYRCTQILYGYGASGSFSGRNFTRSYLGGDNWSAWNKIVSEDTTNTFSSLNTFNSTVRINANTEFDNGRTISFKNTTGTNLGILTLTSSNAVGIGSTAVPISINSSANPTVRVGSTNYTMYHTGNKPTADDVGLGSTSTPTFASVNLVSTSDAAVNMNGVILRGNAQGQAVLSTANKPINIRPKGDADATQAVVIDPATAQVNLTGLGLYTANAATFNANVTINNGLALRGSMRTRPVNNTDWANIGFFDTDNTTQRGALWCDKDGVMGMMAKGGKSVTYSSDGLLNVQYGYLSVGQDISNSVGEGNDSFIKAQFFNKGWMELYGTNPYQENGNGQWVRQINGMRLLQKGSDNVAQQYMVTRTGTGNSGFVINQQGYGKQGWFEFRNDAHLTVNGTDPIIEVGSARFHKDGNIWGDQWANGVDGYLKTWLSRNGVSDIRLKENFAECEGSALDKVRQIEFVQFDWNEQTRDFKNATHVNYGWKAQQLEEIDPGLITKQYGDVSLNPDLSTILPLAFKSISELDNEVQELKSENAVLKDALVKLEERIAALEQNK